MFNLAEPSPTGELTNQNDKPLAIELIYNFEPNVMIVISFV